MWFRSQAGFSLIESSFALGIITVSALGLLIYLNGLNKFAKIDQVKADGLEASLKVKELILNDEKWGLTLASATNNSTLACLRATPFVAACTAGSIAGGIDFYEINPITLLPVLVYSSKTTTPLYGIDRQGNFCRGFDAASGNDSCPYRLETSLELECNAGCDKRNLLISGRLLYSPTKKDTSANLSLGDFFVNRQMPFFIEQTDCENFGGTFNAGTRECVLPTKAVACASASQAIVGFSNGLAICRDI